MSSETSQMGDVEWKVQYVISDDPNAKRAAEFAASEHHLVFAMVISGYKITFSNEVVFYYLVILAKDSNSNGDSKLFFTVVKVFPQPVVLLFAPMNLSDLEITLQMGGDDGKKQLFPPNTADGKVLPVMGYNGNAIEAAKYAAAQNGVEFMGQQYCSGFEIIFTHPPINCPAFYHVKFLGKDRKDGHTKFFFTIVETIFTKPIDLVLLFTPVKSSPSENRQMGGTGGDVLHPLDLIVDGKMVLINENDDYARKAGEFAATKNRMKFKGISSGFLIIFPTLTPKPAYYHLIISAEEEDEDDNQGWIHKGWTNLLKKFAWLKLLLVKCFPFFFGVGSALDGNGDSQLYFTIVVDKYDEYDTPDAVMLFTHV